MYNFDRIYYQKMPNCDKEEWFFISREGLFGPFPTVDNTLAALQTFVKYKITVGDLGGRSFGKLYLEDYEEIQFVNFKTNARPQQTKLFF